MSITNIYIIKEHIRTRLYKNIYIFDLTDCHKVNIFMKLTLKKFRISQTTSIHNPLGLPFEFPCTEFLELFEFALGCFLPPAMSFGEHLPPSQPARGVSSKGIVSILNGWRTIPEECLTICCDSICDQESRCIKKYFKNSHISVS